MFTLRIEGIPVPQHRPRFTRLGHAYDDQKVVKGQYRWQIQSQYKDQPLTGPLCLEFLFCMPIPKSTSKAIKNDMSNNRFFHMKKPDLDNLIKLIEDTMTGVVYMDDSQIAEIHAKKIYSEYPCTLVTVKCLNLYQKNENNI